MIRILGIPLNDNKPIYIALTAIYGIGITRSKQILKALNFNPQLRLYKFSFKKINLLQKIIENSTFPLEGDLKQIIKRNIKHLIISKTRRGQRHLKHLPLRGQRTRTNSRTSRKISIF